MKHSKHPLTGTANSDIGAGSQTEYQESELQQHDPV